MGLLQDPVADGGAVGEGVASQQQGEEFFDLAETQSHGPGDGGQLALPVRAQVDGQRGALLGLQELELLAQMLVLLEKLGTAGLMRTRLARSLADSAWSMFDRTLAYKVGWLGGTLTHADRFFHPNFLFHLQLSPYMITGNSSGPWYGNSNIISVRSSVT